MSRLKCGDCGASIGGKTGLREVEALQRHIARKHGRNVSLFDAAEIRLVYEEGQPYYTALEKHSGGAA